MNHFKNTIATISLFFICFSVAFGQIPQKMSYQSVVRNADGELAVNATIGVKISVLKDAENGTVVYEESQTNSTNENGLLSIEIGGGIPITGTFSGINWASGIYYLKTETDPNGGTNYTISGVGQLLSVPYALYSGSSSNPGKSTIILTGDITDSEAAAQISAEFGNNTENLIIDNTTVLTTVDLSMFKKLLELKVTENEALISLSLPQLKSIYNECIIAVNPVLTSIDFPTYGFVSKELVINNNPLLTNITFPNLTKTRNSSTISIYKNASLSTVAFPQLSISNGSLSFFENEVLASINLGNLTQCFNIQISADALTSLSLNSLVHATYLEFIVKTLTTANLSNLIEGTISMNAEELATLNLNAFTTGDLTISSNVLTDLSLPSYSTGNFNISCDNLISLDLPLFSNSNSLSISRTAITQLTFPSLTTTGVMYVVQNPVLTNIYFPAMTSASQILIDTNAQLNQIDFPVLNQINVVPGSTVLQFANCALPTASINYLLNKLLNASPSTGKYIVLQNQNPPAPPTGQGIIDKQALIDAGNTVISD